MNTGLDGRGSAERGRCACGCGAKTNLAKVNNRERGHVRGEPVHYLLGHHVRTAATREALRVAQTGKRHTDATRAKLSALNTGAANPAWRGRAPEPEPELTYAGRTRALRTLVDRAARERLDGAEAVSRIRVMLAKQPVPKERLYVNCAERGISRAAVDAACKALRVRKDRETGRLRLPVVRA